MLIDARQPIAVPVRKLSLSISSHFGAIRSGNVHLQLKIAKTIINLKPSILRVQGCSRSSMLIPLKSPSALVMVSSKSMFICNRFHADEPTA